MYFILVNSTWEPSQTCPVPHTAMALIIWTPSLPRHLVMYPLALASVFPRMPAQLPGCTLSSLLAGTVHQSYLFCLSSPLPQPCLALLNIRLSGPLTDFVTQGYLNAAATGGLKKDSVDLMLGKSVIRNWGKCRSVCSICGFWVWPHADSKDHTPPNIEAALQSYNASTDSCSQWVRPNYLGIWPRMESIGFCENRQRMPQPFVPLKRCSPFLANAKWLVVVSAAFSVVCFSSVWGIVLFHFKLLSNMQKITWFSFRVSHSDQRG